MDGHPQGLRLRWSTTAKKWRVGYGSKAFKLVETGADTPEEAIEKAHAFLLKYKPEWLNQDASAE